MEPRYLKPDEYAKRLRVSARTVTNLCAKGQLNAEKVGRQWRIPNPDYKGKRR